MLCFAISQALNLDAKNQAGEVAAELPAQFSISQRNYTSLQQHSVMKEQRRMLECP